MTVWALADKAEGADGRYRDTLSSTAQLVHLITGGDRTDLCSVCLDRFPLDQTSVVLNRFEICRWGETLYQLPYGPNCRVSSPLRSSISQGISGCTRSWLWWQGVDCLPLQWV